MASTTGGGDSRRVTQDGDRELSIIRPRAKVPGRKAVLQLKASFGEIAIEVGHRVALSVESDDEYAVRGQVTAQRDQRGDLGSGSDKGDDIPSAHDRVEGLRRAKVQGGEVSQDVIGTRMVDAGCIEKHRIDIDPYNTMAAAVQGRSKRPCPHPASSTRPPGAINASMSRASPWMSTPSAANSRKWSAYHSEWPSSVSVNHRGADATLVSLSRHHFDSNRDQLASASIQRAHR